MPNMTPNFSLPYPNSDDEPCDFAAQWCDFAAAVNEVLDGFQSTVDRVYPTIPAAGLRVTTSRSYSGATTGAVQFDTVAFDTAGWTDFDTDNTSITVDRGGVFGDLGSFIADPDGVNSIWALSIMDRITLPTSQTVEVDSFHQFLDRGTGGTRVGIETFNSRLRSFPMETTLSVGPPAEPYTVTNGYLSIWWHADTVRSA